MSPDIARPKETARRHLSRRRLLALLGGMALVGGGAAWRSFRNSLNAAEARVTHASEVIPTRFGTLEYATRGAGSPILMIHGTGGGFDQGLGMSEPLLHRGYRLIAPSRFGYLRSDFPED